MKKINTQLATILVVLTMAPYSMAGVYKYVDDSGNTVYTDQQPKGEATNVEKLNVKDAYTNTMAAPVDNSKNSEEDPSFDGSQSVFEEIQQQQKQEETYAESKRKAKKEAKRAVTSAKTALEDAKVIQSGDILNNVGGGIRYTQQYLQRVEGAQQRLDKAQKNYSQF